MANDEDEEEEEKDDLRYCDWKEMKMKEKKTANDQRRRRIQSIISIHLSRYERKMMMMETTTRCNWVRTSEAKCSL